MLINKLYGSLLGAAIGDAIGLQTNKKISKIILQEFPNDIDFPYQNDISPYKANDWTVNTDMMILIADTLKHSKINENQSIIVNTDKPMNNLIFHDRSGKRVDYPPTDIELNPPSALNSLSRERLFAYLLKKWVKEGFKELGDHTGIGCSSYISDLVNRQGFLIDPLYVAEIVSKKHLKNGGIPANNDCLSRAIICGWLATQDNCCITAEMLCKVSHQDSRCISVSVIIADLCYKFIHIKDSYMFIIDILHQSLKLGRYYVSGKWLKEYDYFTGIDVSTGKYQFAKLSEYQLELDDDEKQYYVFKTLSVIVWALQSFNDCLLSDDLSHNLSDKLNLYFKNIITKIIKFGGCSSINACIIGGIFGSIIGDSNLPQDWLSGLSHLQWLKSRIGDFISNS